MRLEGPDFVCLHLIIRILERKDNTVTTLKRCVNIGVRAKIGSEMLHISEMITKTTSTH